MSLKLIGGLILTLLCTFLGTNYSKKYCGKRDFFSEAVSFGVHLKREISFTSASIEKICESFKTENEEFKKLLNSVTPFEKGIGELYLPAFILPDEERCIKDYFSKFGKSSRINEAELAEMFVKEMEGYREAEKIKCAKIVGTSTKFGFFIGAVIMVIIW